MYVSRYIFGGLVVFTLGILYVYTKTSPYIIVASSTQRKIRQEGDKTNEMWFTFLDNKDLPDNDRTNKSTQERLEARKHWLRSSCRLMMSKGFTPPNSLMFKNEYLQHFIVQQEKRISYCYLPKVANTNLRRVFLWLQGVIPKTEVETVDGGDVYNVYGDDLFLLGQYNVKQRRKILDTYRKFMVVRDPFERLLSAYRNKFSRHNPIECAKWHRKVKLFYNDHTHLTSWGGTKVRTDFESKELTFLEYIVYFVHTYEEHAYLNEHFTASNQLCDPCRTKIDYIAKFETLNEDLPYIFRTLNIDIEMPGTDFYSNQTRTVAKQYFKNVPVELIMKVWNIVKFDYLLFGYNLPPWFKDIIEYEM